MIQIPQKLILPINNCQINAGYKSKKYLKEWGFNHYGVDLIERSKQRSVYACGNGTVAACGMDGGTPELLLGNCVVIVYRDVQLPGGRIADLSCRMFHLDKIRCRVGDKVTTGTVIGEYGSTGQYSSGPHLHIEFDSDVQYPAYAYGIKQSGNVIKRGSVDSTLDPCGVFWLGRGQSLYAPPQWIADGWVDDASTTLPSAGDDTANSDTAEAMEHLRSENLAMKSLIAQLHEMTR